jgi:outer membrane usher protein
MVIGSIAYAEDQILALEVTLNGRATQLIAQFTLRDGVVYASAEELRAIGVALPPDDGDETPMSPVSSIQLIPLNRFANRVRIDPAAQTIAIDVPADHLATTELLVGTLASSSLPLADSGVGMVLNYNLLASRDGPRRTLSGLLDGRFYSNAGVLESSALLYAGDVAAGFGRPAPLVRLDTVYTRSDPRTLRRYRFGDFVGSGLSWSRPVRFGGAQLSTDFNLRPDLVLYPTPAIRGEATVPSNVDLFVNGVRQFSHPVAPGPFEIRQAPIASGAGQIAVAVTDALGRQSFQNLAFYTSGKLLTPGLSSYALEGGWVRRDYGLAGSDYGQAALSSSLRYGATPALTLEAHGEGMRALQQAGAGLVANINNWGILSASVAASRSSRDGGHGVQTSLGIERNAGNMNFSLSKIMAGTGYRDIGAIMGSPISRSQTTAGFGLSLDNSGSFNAAYTEVNAAAFSDLARNGAGDADIKVLSLSYFKSLFHQATLFVSAFKQLNADHANANVTIGLVIPFGRRDVIGVTGTDGGGARQLSLQASRPTVSPGDIGWQLQQAGGPFVQRSAEFAYKGVHGLSSLAFSQYGGQAGERIGLRGAIVAADRSLFLSNWIDDSFAVVSAGGMEDIGVFAENRFAGRTGDGGRLLLPDLRSYDANRIAINVLDLPIDADVDAVERMVKPRDRSGVVVRFDARRSNSAKVILVDRDGAFVPAGASVTVVESGQTAPVAYGGETFLSGLRRDNHLRVQLPDGGNCTAAFAWFERPGTIPNIGPVVCGIQP